MAKPRPATSADFNALSTTIKTEFGELASMMSTLNNTMLANTSAINATAKDANSDKKPDKSVIKNLTTRIDAVNRSVSSLHTGLEKFVASLDKTQKQFGVSIGNAAEIQIAGLEASIRSYINSFKSLDFTGLGDATSSLLKGDFKEFETKLKQSREGIQAPRQAFTGPEFTDALAEIQKEFGVINKQTADDIAQVAKQKGVTAQALVAARRVFATQTLGDLNKVNEVQNKFLTIFEQKGLSAKVALESIAKYSELLARNGTRFATSFTRAAADAKKIGVDLSKIDQIGDSIISDFEGFLEKQAELGAMGFNFDSSRIAELAESGDTGALFTELRSQLAATGKDITKLRRSERLALEGAFGINISELQRMAGGTPEDKTVEELTVDNNSLLSNILTAVAPLAGALLVIGGALTTISGLLVASGAIGTVIAALGVGGVIGAAILAIAFKSAQFTEKQFEEQKRLTELSLKQAAAGNYAGASKSAEKATIAGAGLNAGIMGSVDTYGTGIPQGMGTFSAVREGKELQQQINDIYRLQKLSVGNINIGPTNPTNPYRGMESGIYTMPQFAPRATSGDRYNQRLADEAVLRGQALTPPVKKAAGGLVTGPGTGKSDSISARLSNGEFVINADMVKKLGLPFLNQLNSGISKAQEIKAGGVEGLFSMAQNKLGGGLKGLAGNLLGKVGLGSLGGGLLGGPMGMLGMAAPLLKKLPFVGSALGAIAGGPNKLIGSALGKIGGLFGKKKASVANMLPPQMQAMLSGGQPGMEGVNLSTMLSQIMGSQQTQAPAAPPISVDTRGIEQKLNNFIAALQGIQINMDGAQVGKVLVNFSDVAGTTGILRPRTSATF